MKKIHPAYIITFIFLLLSTIIIYDNYNDKVLIGELKIKNDMINDLANDLPDGGYKICSFKDNKCGNFYKEKMEDSD